MTQEPAIFTETPEPRPEARHPLRGTVVRALVFALLALAFLAPSPARAQELVCGDLPNTVSWYDPAWPKRKAVIIDHTRVSAPGSGGTLADFPVLLDITDADFADPSAQLDALIITLADGVTTLDHEIENVDTGAGSIRVWLRIPSLPEDDDLGLFVYYGNVGAPSQESVSGVWTASYRKVWHMDQDPSGGGAPILDSSPIGNHGNPSNMASNDVVAARVGSGLDFDGSNDYVDSIAPIGISGSGAYTIEAWVFPRTNTDTFSPAEFGRAIEMWGTAGTEGATFLYYHSTHQNFDLGHYANDTDSSGSLPNNTWYHVVWTYSGGNEVFYVNGATNRTRSVGGLNVQNTATRTGGDTFGQNRYFDGIIDELRVSSVGRSAEYAATTYNNQNDPAGFLDAVCAQQRPPGAVATYAVAEISPNEVTVGAGAQSFVYDIDLVIEAGDSGVDTIEITVPASFGLPTVTAVNGSGSGYTDNTSGRDISLRLSSKIVGDASVEVSFTANAPSSSVGGDPFLSAVDDSTNADPAQATSEGNGDGDSGDANSWSVAAAPASPDLVCGDLPRGIPWYDLDWSSRKPLILQRSEITGTVTDFPALVAIVDTDLQTALSDGSDIRFTSADGTTLLYHEIEEFDVASGRLIAWVRMPSLDDNFDTGIFVYWGNASPGAPPDPTMVWNSGFALVAHLRAAQSTDSTANGHTASTIGTPQGYAGLMNSIVAQSNSATYFDAASDRFDYGDINAFDNLTRMTASFWVNVPTQIDRGAIWGKNSGGSSCWGFATSDQVFGIGPDSNDVAFVVRDCNDLDPDVVHTDSNVLNSNVTRHFTVRFDGSAGSSSSRLRIWVDGVEPGSNDVRGSIPTSLSASSPPFVIGGGSGSVTQHRPRMDEFQLSTVARSTDWIRTTYDTQSDPGSFISVCPIQDSTRLYYALGSQVVRAFSDGSGAQAVATGLTDASYLDVDPIAGRIYWTDTGTGTISRANFDGSSPANLLTGLGSPAGVAIDAARAKLYWVDSGSDTLHRANLDGSGEETLYTGSDMVDLAIDSAGGRIYFRDGAAIRSANLDGAAAVDIIGGLSDVRAIDLDVGAQRIYWVDNATGQVRRVSFDGSGAATVASGLSAPVGLTLKTSTGKLYFGEQTTGEINVANLDGSGASSNVVSGGVGQLRDVEWSADEAGGNAYAATSAIAEILPTSVQIRAPTSFTYTLEVSVSAGDSGVDHVDIQVPASFGVPSNVAVTGDPGATIGISRKNIGIDLSTRRTTDFTLEVTFDADAASFAGSADFTSRVSDTATALPAINASPGDANATPADSDTWTVATVLPAADPKDCTDFPASTNYYDASWAYRKALVFDHAQIAGTESNFPVLVSITDSDLAVARPDGADIRFTAGDGLTLLDHEIEFFDQPSGQLIAWVRLPAVTANAGTGVFMYYGHPSPPAAPAPTGTWDASFQAVLHMDTFNDSTANAIIGAPTGPPTTTTLQIGEAQDFAGASQHLSLGDVGSLEGIAQLTVSAWVRPDTSVEDAPIVSKKNDGTHDTYWYMNTGATSQTHTGAPSTSGGSNDVLVGVANGSDRHSAYTIGNLVPTGQIHQWTFVYDGQAPAGDQVRVYVDGARRTVVQYPDLDAPTTLGSNAHAIRLARHTGGGALLDGQIDEVQLSSTARSEGWIATAYNNQSNPAGFTNVCGEQDGTKLYIATTGSDEIKRAFTDGSDLATIVSAPAAAQLGDIAIDGSGGYVFFADAGQDTIARTNLDGSSQVVLFDNATHGVVNPIGVTLDIAAGKLYWTESGRVRRAEIDGRGTPEDLFDGGDGLVDPRGIKLDSAAGKLYLVDYATGKIQRGNLDGSGVLEDLFEGADGISAPTDLAIDIGASLIFWLDDGTGKLQSGNIDGFGAPTDLATGYTTPTGLELNTTTSKLYFTDLAAHELYEIETDGSNLVTLLSGSGTINAPGGLGLGPSGAGGLGYAVSSALAEISPNAANTGSTGNPFVYDVAISTTGGSGVDQVRIYVPASFANPVLTGVQVDGASAGFTPASTGNTLIANLATKVTGDRRITVFFTADAPATPDLTGVDFVAALDDRTTQTGLQNAIEGDGNGDGGADLDSWTVATFDFPAANLVLAEISPNQIQRDATEQPFQYDLLPDISAGTTGVDRVAITIPAAFTNPNVTAVEVGGAAVTYAESFAGGVLTVTLTQKVVSTQNIRVYLTLDAPSVNGTESFPSTVDDTGTGVAPDPTTEGNGDQDGSDNNLFSITTVDPSPFEKIYWTGPDDDAVRRASLDGSDVETLVASSTGPNGIAVDLVNGFIFYTDIDADVLYRANLNGSGATPIVTGQINPAGVAVDGLGGYVYWVSATQGIRRSRLDGTNATTLLNDPTTGTPGYGIALDVASGKIYWSDAINDKIYRANLLDGSNIEDLTAGGIVVSSPGGIALDLANDKIYYVDRGNDRIQYANLDGSGPTDVATGLSSPIDVAVDPTAGRIYWSEDGTDRLASANLDGSSPLTVLSTGLGAPKFIALGPDGAGAAGAAVFSALAEISPTTVIPGADDVDFTYTIRPVINSETGVNMVEIRVPLTFGPPTVTGVSINGSPLLPLTYVNLTLGRVIRITLLSKLTSTSTIEVRFRADAPNSPDFSGVEFRSQVDDLLTTLIAGQDAVPGNADGDPSDANSWTVTTRDPPKIYFSDLGSGPGTGFIGRANRDGSALETLISGVDSAFVAIDLGGGKLYYADQSTQTIQRADLDGGNPETLLTSHSNVTCLALDLVGGTMYFASDSGGAAIRRANLDGTGLTTLLATADSIRQIELDPANGRMFVLNASTASVQTKDLGTGGLTTISGVATGANPTGLAVDLVSPDPNKALYWTAGSPTNHIQTTDPDGPPPAIATLVSGLSNPTDVAVDLAAGKLYWSEDGSDVIRRRDIGGGAVEDIVTSGLVSPSGISLDAGQSQVVPAAGSVAVEIVPDDVLVNSTANRMSYYFDLAMSASSSGVDHFEITVPGTFGPPSVVDVRVNGVSVGFSDATSGQTIDVDVASKITTSSRVRIVFDVDAPTATDAVGVSFPSLVDDSVTSASPQAGIAGEADGNPANGNGIVVTTSDRAVDSAVAEIDPTLVNISTPDVGMIYDLDLAITTGTGVDRIVLVVPSSFGAPALQGVRQNGVALGAGQFTNLTSGNQIQIDLATKVTTDVTFQILFTANAPTAVNAVGEEFRSYVDDTTTTGVPQAAVQGNADGDATDGNTWRVRTTTTGGGGATFFSKLYWTDDTTNAIYRSDLDGANVETLVTGLTSPYGLDINIAAARMYWTDEAAGKVSRASIDGTNVEDVITGLVAPGYLRLDPAAGKLYFIDNGTNKIHRANLDGSGLEEVITTIPSPTTNWFDPAWSYRKRITLDRTQVSGTHTSFPVLLQISDSDLSAARADGYDLVFTTAGGTSQLNHQIETFNNVSGDLLVWVTVPSLSDTADLELYLYYGNASATDQQNADGAFGNDYAFVAHMQGNDFDSSGEGHNGTPQSGPGFTTGKIGQARDFRSGGHVEYGSADTIEGERRATISAWVNSETHSSDDTLIGVGNSENNCWRLGFSPSGSDRAAFSNGDCDGFYIFLLGPYGVERLRTTSNIANDGVWQHWAMVFDGSRGGGGAKGTFYLNGSPVSMQENNDDIISAIANASGNLHVGRGPNSSRFDGIVDEVRLQSVARSGSWILTEYTNQDNPTAIVKTISAEEAYVPFVGSVRRGLDLDLAARYLYWVDEGNDLIQRADLDTFTIETVISGGDVAQAKDLELDLASGEMWWAEAGNNALYDANLDGSSPGPAVSALTDPEGIALDLSTGIVYLSDPGSGKLQSANMSDGSGLTDLLTGQGRIRDVALGLGGAQTQGDAVTSVVAEIDPVTIVIGSTSVAMDYDILPTIGPGDTGVDTVTIDIPSGFAVTSVDGVKVGGTSVAYTSSTTSGSIRVTLGTKVTSTQTIQVQFTANAPGVPVTAAFTSSVDDSTTAISIQNAVEGDANNVPDDRFDSEGPDNTYTVLVGTPSGGEILPMNVEDGDISESTGNIEVCNLGARRDLIAGWAGWTPATAQELLDLAASDDVRYAHPGPPAGKNAAMIFEATYGGDANQTLEINIANEIYAASGGQEITACLWNYATGEYDPMTRSTFAGDQERDIHQVSYAGEYVDLATGQVTLFLVNNTVDNGFAVDQVEIRVQPYVAPPATASLLAEDGHVNLSSADIDACNISARRDTIAGWADWHPATSIELFYLPIAGSGYHEAPLPRANQNWATLYEFERSEDPNGTWFFNFTIAGSTLSQTNDHLSVCLWDYLANAYVPLATFAQNTTSDTTITAQAASAPLQHMDANGQVTVLILNDRQTDHNGARIDQIQLALSSGGTETVAPSTAQDGWVDQENFATTGFGGPHYSDISQYGSWNNASSAELTAISSSGGSYWGADTGGGGDHNAIYFEYFVTAPEASIDTITIDIELARQDNDSSGYAYVWNYSADTWYALGSWPGGSTPVGQTFALSGTIASDIVEDGTGKVVLFIVNNDDYFDELRLYYLNFEVTTGSPEVGASLAEISPNTVQPGSGTNSFEYAITPNLSEPTSETGDGLLGTYYDQNTIEGAYFTGNTATRVDPTISFDWGTSGIPYPGFPSADYYTIRWTGQVRTEAAGNYTFEVEANDGVRLYVDGNLIIDQFVSQPATVMTAAPIALAGDTGYDIVLEYLERYSSAEVELRWSGPGISMQVIPQDNLYSTGVSAGPDRVNRIEIDVPGDFSNPVISSVSVGGSPVPFADASSGNTLVANLPAAVTTESVIRVNFDADVPLNPSPAMYAFTSRIDDTSDAESPTATIEGNGDGDGGDNDSWEVRSPFTPSSCLWSSTKDIVIQASQIDADLYDFPLLVKLSSDAQLAAQARADGYDIVFTDQSDLQLPHEIEYFDPGTGELVAWVRVPFVSSSTNTTIKMYYGYAGATDTQMPTGVWDANYRRVWHMNNDPSTGGAPVLDSTSRYNHGVASNMAANDVVASQIGRGLDFDGSNDRIESSSAIGISGNDPWTMEAWVYPRANAETGGYGNAIDSWGSMTTSQANFIYYNSTQSRFEFGHWLDDTNSAGVQTNFNWYHIVWTFDGSTERFYINGSQNSSFAQTLGALQNTTTKTASRLSQDSRFFNGILDELRISNVARSNAYVTATYRNQATPGSFVSVGGEQPAGGATVSQFAISHDGAGIHCLPETITVTAQSCSGQPVTDYTGTIEIDTQTTKGSWIGHNGSGTLDAGAGGDGRAQYTFDPADGGVVSLSLSYSEGTVAMDIDAYSVASSALRDTDSEGTMTFYPSGFTFTASPLPNPPTAGYSDPIQTQTAGTPFPAYVTAYGTTPDDPVCGVIETYTGAKFLELWSTYADPTYVDPSTAPTAVSVDGNSIGKSASTPTSLPLTFTNGQAQIEIKYKDVGRIGVYMRDPAVPEPAGGIAGTSGNFVVRPADLVITAIEDQALNPAPPTTDHTGAGFVPAGESFWVEVEARDAEGDPAPSFGTESAPEQIRILSVVDGLYPLPAPNGTTGTRNGSDGIGSLQGGVFAAGTMRALVSYDEVGVIVLRASVSDDDYLGTGAVLGTVSAPVGRFYPDRFDVTVIQEPLLDSSCDAGGFSYMGESIGFVTTPQLRVRPLSQSGGQINNYQGNFFKMGSSPNVIWGLTGAPLARLDTTNTNFQAAPDGALLGTALVDATGSPWLAITRAGNSTDLLAPFDAQIDLTLEVADPDQATPSSFTWNNIQFDGGAGANSFMYGRIQVGNNYGSEIEPLALPVTVEYYTTAGGWMQNTGDACTAIDPGVGFPEFSFVDVPPTVGLALLSGISAVDPQGAGIWPMMLTGGQADLWLAPPGAAQSGEVRVTIDLGALGLSHLEWDENGDSVPDPPSGVGTFGVYAGDDMLIYQREVFD